MSFHAGQTFTFGEQPSATKWQYLWDNDYALADGTGISNDAILARHILNGVVNLAKMDFSTWPMFRAYLTSAQVVTTASGTVALASTTEAYDVTNNMANATNIFTAPATGKYLFTYHVSDNSGNVTRMTPIIRKNGATNYSGTQGNQSFSTGVLILEIGLTSGDTMQAMINANPSNGQLIAGDTGSWWTGRRVG